LGFLHDPPIPEGRKQIIKLNSVPFSKTAFNPPGLRPLGSAGEFYRAGTSMQSKAFIATCRDRYENAEEKVSIRADSRFIRFGGVPKKLDRRVVCQ
jgi:hypothetical protein